MTEYLEWASQEGAEALLEEHRRVEQMGLSVYDGRPEGAEVPGLSGAAAAPEEELPLLRQMLQAEERTRQAAAWTQRGAAEQILPLVRPGRDFESAQSAWPELSGMGGLLRKTEESIDTAGVTRQVDLAFRRDSRRYDSGFYLY